MQSTPVWAAAAATLLAAAPAALSQSASSAAHVGAESLAVPRDAEDIEFLQEAVRTDLAEIRLGQLAEQRARAPRVREYGAKLQADHESAMQEKAALLRTLGFDVPTEPSAEALQIRDAFAMLPNGAFDVEFTALMIETHEKAAEEYGAQTHANPNEALADVARSGLEMVREHLSIAESLRSDALAQSRTPRAPTGLGARD